MIIPPPVVVYGGCTYERAIDIIHGLRLQNCEAMPRPVSGIWFYQEKDLLLFMFEFGEVVEFEDHLAMIFPEQQEATDAFVSEYDMESRIARSDLLAVRFWDLADRRAFEEGLGLSRHSI